MIKILSILCMAFTAYILLTAEIDIVMANVLFANKSFLYIGINGNYEFYTLPFNTTPFHWSW